MATLPYMPLFVGDYLADTMGLTTEQHGAYLLLLMSYWKNGPLPDDDSRLAATCKMTAESWACSKHALASLFDVRDGQWFNRRQDKERKLAAEKKEKSSEKSKAAAEARWKGHKPSIASGNAPSMPQAMPGGMLEDCPSSSSSKKGESELGTPIETQQKKESSTPAIDRSSDRSVAAKFAQFWDRYPNKVGKKAAERKFLMIAKSKIVTFAELMAGLERYAGKQDDRPWCNPTRWLNEHRWTDEPAATTMIGGLNARPSARVQHARNAFGRSHERALAEERARLDREAGADGRHALPGPVDDGRRDLGHGDPGPASSRGDGD